MTNLTMEDLAKMVQGVIKEATEKHQKLNEEYYSFSDETVKNLWGIISACNAICDKNQHTQEDGYEPDPERGYEDDAFLYKWAEKVMNEASSWLRRP